MCFVKYKKACETCTRAAEIEMLTQSCIASETLAFVAFEALLLERREPVPQRRPQQNQRNTHARNGGTCGNES